MLAFPSTYTVGITSLGYQLVWASLAMRSDLDVRRLFTDQGDPQHRRCDLFGLSLSWELDGPVLLDLLEQQRIPLWSHERGDQDPIVYRFDAESLTLPNHQRLLMTKPKNLIPRRILDLMAKTKKRND